MDKYLTKRKTIITLLFINVVGLKNLGHLLLLRLNGWLRSHCSSTLGYINELSSSSVYVSTTL